MDIEPILRTMPADLWDRVVDRIVDRLLADAPAAKAAHHPSDGAFAKARADAENKDFRLALDVTLNPPQEHPMSFLAEDYAHISDLIASALLDRRDADLRAILSNNLSIIRAALLLASDAAEDVKAEIRNADPADFGLAIANLTRAA